MDNSAKDQSTEQKILDVATQVFLRKGHAGARMQDIADEAGINKALLHYYFRSKDKLFDIIFKEASVKFLAIQQIFTADLPLTEKIERFVEDYITILSQHPYVPMFILNEIHKNPDDFFKTFLAPGKSTAAKKFIEQANAAVKKKIIKPIDGRQLLLNMISMCVFPFVSKPMFQMLAGVNDKEFKNVIEERKKGVSKFILDAITP